MCGIAGKYFWDASRFGSEDLDAMLSSIMHRGPDSAGRFAGGRALLGFRRLSIIDTVGGDQPLFSEDGNVVVLANGEIYNYQELRRLSQARAHRFRTGSDCEVLVHLYEEFGNAFVEKLNGMFAFCLYDRKQDKLLLGRDRMGIKPLYYTTQGSVLIFASEIKAIIQASEVRATERADTLDEYLCFRSLSGTRTFFKDIKLLAPGFLLEVDREGARLQRYWRPTIRQRQATSDSIAHDIRDAMRSSVRKQLMADVPLGTQLSGGVDSSWVSVLGATAVPGMMSFTVSFADRDFDESREARIVAEQVGLNYHEVASDPLQFSTLLPKIVWHNDEPLTHANSVEIYHLCRYARDHVKVLLTGEGADELFGGYPRYYLCRLWQRYERLPRLFRPSFRFLADRLSRGRGRRPSHYLEMTPRGMVFWNAAFASSHRVGWLMDKEEVDLAERWALLDANWEEDLTLLDNLLLHELQNYLQPILLRQDKMSMAASIEARVPILDNDVVELALGIPGERKIANLRPKYLFKRAAAMDLPSRIVHKRKVGFGVPVGRWMREGGPMGQYLDLLSDQRRNVPGVNPAKLDTIVREHREGISDHQDLLWPLVNYVIWREVFLGGAGDAG